jgi:hypothetical protein
MVLTPVQESLAELLRRAEITSKARYSAGRRMELHRAFSQWTLAFLAVGQIVISLVVALKLRINFSPAYVDFGGIFFGVLVLAYSLLLGMGNYAARALKLRAGGVELGGIARSLHYQSRDVQSTQSDYDQSARKYYEVLSRHENHINIDYLTAYRDSFERGLEEVEFLSKLYFRKRLQILMLLAKIYFGRAFQYLHYAVTIVLISAWIYKLIVK